MGSSGFEPGAVLDVLLVEDDPGDALMVAEALADSPVRLHVVRDGEEALAFLLRDAEHRDAPRPGLVLLDLNLPRLDGREMLCQVKAHDGLRSIPVVVLTGSQAEVDVLSSYTSHANAYLAKPSDAEEFAAVVRQVAGFFGTVACLPG
ncbi:response regulator [Saccharothrix xinjiangensis]|uniref:Response regulator n=1 Tax=Saccharothrix xinjiangensis TaxID=204798 RepID=A0ABV9YGA6_9PSEU